MVLLYFWETPQGVEAPRQETVQELVLEHHPLIQSHSQKLPIVLLEHPGSLYHCSQPDKYTEKRVRDAPKGGLRRKY